MTPEQWQAVRPILESALDLDPESRASYLDGACADAFLRQEVESLLASHERAGTKILAPGAAPSFDDADEPHFASLTGTRIGPYEIVQEIAVGGMGAVYRAIRADGQYRQQVALKIVRADLGSAHSTARFRNERQILASLDHPGIARILDGGTTESGLPYLVMEFIDGLPVTEYCDKHKLSIEARLKLFRSICAAVHYAHQRLVIHRDIKPSNILVTADGAPKLLDFGIAKILDPGLLEQNVTLTGAALWLMTPEYASPEQLRGEPITTATDVYSLGLVLYELLTGHHAYCFSGRMPHEIAQVVLETDPEKPSTLIRHSEKRREKDANKVPLTEDLVSELRSDLPKKLGRRLSGDLDNIVLTAIRKEPRERYSSVDRLSEDIHRHLDGVPVFARKDTFAYRASKFVSRHKIGVSLAAVATVAMLAGLAATLYEAHVARVQRARAEARFNDVRALANSLMFDVHDSIQDLPGSTPARKLLVDRALRYLDSLSRDAASDASLQRELATAYEKVGTVQGDAFGANLGDTGGALESFRKASTIRQALLETNPQNVDDLIPLAHIQRLIGGVLANRGDSACLALLKEAIATSERAIRVAPANESALRELQADYRMLGTLFDGAGDYQASADNFQKAESLINQLLRGAPDDRVLRRDMGSVEMRLGHELASSGSRKQGVPHLQDAVQLFEFLSADRKDSEATRRLAIAHSYLAEALLADGAASAALQHFKEALRIANAVAAADPTNAVAQVDVAYALATLGNGTAVNGDSASGLDLLNRATKMFETQLARDPAYAEPLVDLTSTCMWTGEAFSRMGQTARAMASYQKSFAVFRDYALRNKGTAMEADLALIHAEIGSSLVKLGKTGQAAEEFQRALEIVEPMTSASPNLPEAHYVLAYTYAELGDLSQSLASDTRLPWQQRIQDWDQARYWLRRSLDAWEKIPGPGTRTPMGFVCGSPGSVLRELAKCDAALTLPKGTNARREMEKTN